MISSPLPARLAAGVRLALLGMVAACASVGPVASNRLTPVKDRVTDEAMTRDLAVIASYERRVVRASSPVTGARTYLSTRALEYLALARDAYNRNDRSAFADDALSWAIADLESLEQGTAHAAPATAVRFPVVLREAAPEL